MQAPWWRSKTETCRSDIYVYFNVNFNVFFKLIKVHLLVIELYIYQNARTSLSSFFSLLFHSLKERVCPRDHQAPYVFQLYSVFELTDPNFTKHVIRYNKNSLIQFSCKQSWQYGRYANFWDGSNNDANEYMVKKI